MDNQNTDSQPVRHTFINGKLTRYNLRFVSSAHLHVKDHYSGTVPTCPSQLCGAGVLFYTGEESLTTEQIINLVVANARRAQDDDVVVVIVDIDAGQIKNMLENPSLVIVAHTLAPSQRERFVPDESDVPVVVS